MGGAPTVEVELELRLVFAEIKLQLVSRRERMKVESILRVVSDANYDASKLCRHVRRIDECKRILKDSRDKEQAGGVFIEHREK